MPYLILGKLWDWPVLRGPPFLDSKTLLFSKMAKKIKYGISEPHGDLLQWTLSWAFTLIILVHQEGSVHFVGHKIVVVRM